MPLWIILASMLSNIPPVSGAPPTTPPTPAPDIPSQAWAESVRLFEFLALPEDSRKPRAAEAEKLRKNAAKSTHGPKREAMLLQAVELDPAQPLGWIELAEVLRWMGYRTRAAEALDCGLLAVKQLRGQEKKQAGLEYLLARAWLDYEQGDWAEGKGRADQAVEVGGGLRAQLIAGLNRAGTDIKDKEMRESLRVFYPLERKSNRWRNFWWAYLTWGHLHNVPYSPPDIWGYQPDSFKIPDHEVLRWRDRGLIEEANDADGLAIDAYESSARYHPVGDGGWLRRLERAIPGARPGFPPVPFWVNPDDGYVTGSLLAYQGYCLDRMIRETDPDLRADWAHKVVWSGSAAVHRYPRGAPGRDCGGERPSLSST